MRCANSECGSYNSLNLVPLFTDERSSTIVGYTFMCKKCLGSKPKVEVNFFFKKKKDENDESEHKN